MNNKPSTKFILDSGSVEEYKDIVEFAKTHNFELWGSTTNPSLIAKSLTGKKVTQQEAFYTLQKKIIEEILDLVPGAVSAEVYAAKETTAEQMIEQGRIISQWHPRVVVKLPTTIEGFKARTELRKEGICINNTLVFSQQQVFAITLHEKIMRENYGLVNSPAGKSWSPFISPFVGRLDDIGQDGLSMVEHSINIIKMHFEPDLVWMLEASVRNVLHMKKGLDLNVELITAPAKVYKDWFSLATEQQQTVNTENKTLNKISEWKVPQELLSIDNLDEFMNVLENKSLDISHELTDKGIDRFVADWKQIIIS